MILEEAPAIPVSSRASGVADRPMHIPVRRSTVATSSCALTWGVPCWNSSTPPPVERAAARSYLEQTAFAQPALFAGMVPGGTLAILGRRAVAGPGP